MAEVGLAVLCNIVESTGITSVAEEVNLVGIATVHCVTPVLEGSADAHVVVSATLLIDLADEVIVTVQRLAEVHPIIGQLMAVDVDLVVTQGKAVFCVILVQHSVGAIIMSTGA